MDEVSSHVRLDLPSVYNGKAAGLFHLVREFR